MGSWSSGEYQWAGTSGVWPRSLRSRPVWAHGGKVIGARLIPVAEDEYHLLIDDRDRGSCEYQMPLGTWRNRHTNRPVLLTDDNAIEAAEMLLDRLRRNQTTTTADEYFAPERMRR